MEHLSEALHLFRKHPRLAKYIFAPFLWGLALFLAVAIVGYFLLVPPITGVMSAIGLGRAADEIGLFLFILLWLLISGLLFLAVASFLSSLLWDGLSAEIETILIGGTASYRLSKREIIADSLNRTALTIFLALLALGCAFVIPVIGPLLIAGYAGTLDYTASGFARRGVLLRQQRREIWKLKGWPSFYLVSGLVAIIPFVNVLFMPVMVAAGTVMVIRSPKRH